jgi:hypothetical protein
VVDAQRVAVIDRIEELEENVFDEVVSAKITSLLQNLAKQITIRTVIHNDEGAIFLFNDTMERDNIRVNWCKLVKGDLLHVKTSLASGVSGWCVKKAFDGIWWAVEGRRAKVDRAINNPITTMAQDAHEFECAIVDNGTDSWWTRKKVRHTVGKGLQDLQEEYLGEEEGMGCLTARERVVEEPGEWCKKGLKVWYFYVGPWVRPCGPGTAAACVQHEPTTFPLHK